MADFNNAPPEAQPGVYPFWFKSIEEPKANVSAAIGLKGVAEGIQGFGTVAHNYAEQKIEEDTYKGVDALSSARIQDLNSLNQSLLDNEKQGELPSALANLPKDTSNLVSAKENGKLSDVGFRAQLDVLAKQVRSEFPGMRDYADEVFERATGRTSANKLMTSLTSDINSALEKRKNNQDKIQSFVLQHGPEYLGPDNMNNVISGKMPMQAAYTGIAKAMNDEHMDNLQLRKIALSEKSDEINYRNNAEKIQPILSRASSEVMDTFTTHIGVHYMSLPDVLYAARNHEISTEDMAGAIRDLDQFTANKKAKIYSDLSRPWTDVDGSNPAPRPEYVGKAPIMFLGKTVAEQRAAIDGGFKDVDAQRDLLTNPDTGFAVASAKATQHMQADATYGAGKRLFSNQDMSMYLGSMKLLSEAAGNQTLELSKITDALFAAKGVNNNLNSIWIDGALKLLAQPDPQNPTQSAVPSGNVSTLPGVIQDTKAKESAVPGYGSNAWASLYDGFVNTVSKVLQDHKSGETAHINAGAAAYSQRDGNVMDLLNPNDQVKVMPKLANIRIADVMHRMGDEPFQQYKTANEISYQKAVVNPLRSLSTLPPGTQLAFHDQDGSFTLLGKPPKTAGESVDYNNTLNAIRNLNTLTRSVNSITKYTHETPMDYMLKLWHEGRIEGISDTVIKAMAATKASRDIE